MQDRIIHFNFQRNEALSLFLVILRHTLLKNRSHFSPTPAESVLSRRQPTDIG